MTFELTNCIKEHRDVDTTHPAIINSMKHKELNRVLIETPSLFIKKLKEIKNISIEEQEIELGFCIAYAFFLISQLPEKYKTNAHIHIIHGCHSFVEIDGKCYDGYAMYGVDMSDVNVFIENYFNCEMGEFDNQYFILNKDYFKDNIGEIFNFISPDVVCDFINKLK